VGFETWGEEFLGQYATSTPRRDAPTYPVAGDVTANPDTPVTQGGIPFWTRVWGYMDYIPLSYGFNQRVVKTAETTTKDTLNAAKAAIAAPFRELSANAAAGANRLIIILILVLIGFVIVNRFVARTVAA
jgi:hypothetical protein